LPQARGALCRPESPGASPVGRRTARGRSPSRAK
jgi:hypothetical protein